MSFKAIAWAWEQDLPCVQKMVLLALANCQNDDTLQCNPSFKYIATKAGVQRRTVIHHIQSLADLGLIVVKPDERGNRSKTSNNYLLMTGGSAGESLGSDLNALGVVQEMHQGSDLNAPLETVIKPVSVKPSISSASATEIEKQPTEEIWPEWYSLLYGMDGVTVSYPTADAWRVKKGVSEELAEAKVYALRSWWPRQASSRTKRGSPYATWQDWCTSDKTKGATNATTGIPGGHPQEDSAAQAQREYNERAAASKLRREQHQANLRGVPGCGVGQQAGPGGAS